MKWLDNAVNLAKNGEVGDCPNCKSQDTDYKYVLVNQDTGMGYLSMWCNNCNSEYVISRAKVNKNLKYELNSTAHAVLN